MRKSGKKADSALKVEDIDALSDLPFMKPPPGYVRKSPIEITSREKEKSPEGLGEMVSKLFSRYE